MTQIKNYFQNNKFDLSFFQCYIFVFLRWTSEEKERECLCVCRCTSVRVCAIERVCRYNIKRMPIYRHFGKSF